MDGVLLQKPSLYNVIGSSVSKQLAGLQRCCERLAHWGLAINFPMKELRQGNSGNLVLLSESVGLYGLAAARRANQDYRARLLQLGTGGKSDSECKSER